MNHVDVLLMTSRQLHLGRCQQRSECKTLDLEATLKLRSQGHKNSIRSQCVHYFFYFHSLLKIAFTRWIHKSFASVSLCFTTLTDL